MLSFHWTDRTPGAVRGLVIYMRYIYYVVPKSANTFNETHSRFEQLQDMNVVEPWLSLSLALLAHTV